MTAKKTEHGVKISHCGNINLGVTLDCGQAFRWVKKCDGSWSGVVKGVETSIKETDDGMLFSGITEEQMRDIFYDYFDFGRDYGKVLDALQSDIHIKKAIDSYGTIRILRQEPWEALCSFIFSSCNNIPRIKGIIERFCENFGEKTGERYSFPTAEKTASLTVEDMAVLRAGFRTPYVLGAARMVADGEIDLDSLYKKPLVECENELMKINGVGKKVADCTILFGLGHIEAFPIDRHIKRICENFYPDGLPECTNGIEGIAQQYMFQMQRTGEAE